MNAKLLEAEMLVYSLVGGDDELAAMWWHSPNKRFDGAMPCEIWDKNPDLILNYLRFHCFVK